jgi:hypothetical protein
MKALLLNAIIPYARGGREKALTMQPYPNIKLAMPGRHAKDTVPIGGDFVVMVTDEDKGWIDHQFTHTDLFEDLQSKKNQLPKGVSYIMELDSFMQCYFDVIMGREPAANLNQPLYMKGTLHPQTFLYAAQCLAVAEHRRYHQHEHVFGGRYLPFRFAAGIVEGLWSAAEASSKEKLGRIGVEQLESQRGKPYLTKKLMNED